MNPVPDCVLDSLNQQICRPEEIFTELSCRHTDELNQSVHNNSNLQQFLRIYAENHPSEIFDNENALGDAPVEYTEYKLCRGKTFVDRNLPCRHVGPFSIKKLLEGYCWHISMKQRLWTRLLEIYRQKRTMTSLLSPPDRTSKKRKSKL